MAPAPSVACACYATLLEYFAFHFHTKFKPCLCIQFCFFFSGFLFFSIHSFHSENRRSRLAREHALNICFVLAGVFLTHPNWSFDYRPCLLSTDPFTVKTGPNVCSRPARAGSITQQQLVTLSLSRNILTAVEEVVPQSGQLESAAHQRTVNVSENIWPVSIVHTLLIDPT